MFTLLSSPQNVGARKNARSQSCLLFHGLSGPGSWPVYGVEIYYYLSENKSTKHKNVSESSPGIGGPWGSKLFMCFVCQTLSWGKKETRKQDPRKSQENVGTVQGKSQDNPGISSLMRLLAY